MPRAGRVDAGGLCRAAAALILGVPLLFGFAAGAWAQTASLVLDPTEIQAESLDGATITLIPKNSTFIGAGGGGLTGRGNDFHPDEFSANSLKNPTGEARFSAAGLAKITLSGAPAGLTIASGKLLAREQPHSHGGGNKGHRSAEITLAYSGPAITADDPVTVTVMGGSDDGLLKWGNQNSHTNPPSLSADFTIRAASPGGANLSVSSLAIPNKQSASYWISLTEENSGSVVISLTSDDTATATVSPSTMTFLAGDWPAAEQVTVTGRGEGATSISHAVQSSADPNYPATTTLPGVAVTVGAAESLGDPPTGQVFSTGGTTLPEGLTGVEFTIGLSRHLATDETVTLPLSVGGTATRGTDYRLSCRAGEAITCNGLDGATPTVTFDGARMACNHAASRCRRGSGLSIEVIEDETVESNETVTLNLGAKKALSLTLKDSPSSVQVSFTCPGCFLVLEGDVEGLMQPILRVTPITSRDIAVPLVYRDITATAGEDYEALATAMFFADGSETKSVDIPYFGDTVCEGDETLEIRIDSSRLPAGVTVDASKASTVFTIRNDEACAFGFTESSATVTEGGSVSVTVNLDPPLAADTKVDLTWSDPKRQGDTTTAYHYNHTYDSVLRMGVGQDFQARPLRVTIPANEVSHTFTVRTVDEPAAVLESHWRDREGVVVEPDETFTVTIGDGELPDPAYVNGHRVFTVTIEDNDVPDADTKAPRVASIVRHSPSSSPTAADSLTWRVTFDEAVQNVDAGDFTVSGTTASLAVAPVAGTNAYDVTASGGNLAGLDGTVTLAFASGQNIEDASGNALTQTAPAGTGDNTFVVSNTSPPPPQLPAVTVSAGTSPVTEGAAAGFTVSRSGATASALTVLLTVAENSAGGRDFVAAGDEGDQSVTIPAGSATAAYNVPTVGDGTDEPNGAVTLSLRSSGDYSQGSPSSATVTVNDDDGPAPNACDPDNVRGDVEGYVLETQHGTAHVNRWKRVLAAFGVDNGATAMTAAEAQAFADRGWSRWDPVVAVLTCLENAGAGPEITVTGGGGVTEGGNAVFTVHSNPAPAADLTVALTVDDDATSDFLAAGHEGARNVTILAGEASAALTLPTVQDAADEPDGVVTATVDPGAGYRVGAPGTATVAVADDDGPVVPVVRIAGGGSVTEGGNAVFTLTATPAPGADITVRVEVAETGVFAGSGQTGVKDVTIGAGGTATLTVGTVQDTADEADGAITARVLAGTGYTPHSTGGSASVAVADDDEAPMLPAVGVAGGGDITEGGTARFTLTAAPPAAIAVRVRVTAAGDYLAGGETAGERTVQIPVGGSVSFDIATRDDETDELNGRLEVRVLAGAGYEPSEDNSLAVVRVADNDVPAGAPMLSVDNPTEYECARTMTFTVTLNKPSEDYVTFVYGVRETDPASARRKADFSGPTDGTGHFRPGGPLTQRFKVFIATDRYHENNETFEFFLSQVTGAGVMNGGVGTGTIRNGCSGLGGVVGGVPPANLSGEVGSAGADPAMQRDRWNPESSPAGFGPDAVADFAAGTCVSPRLRSEAAARAKETWRGAAHVERWLRVSRTFSGGANDATVVTPAEASFHAAAARPGWLPVADALGCMERRSLRDALSR